MVQIPALRGVIERRVLVNYRVDPEALQRVLPGDFAPLLVDGHGIGGICLIRLGRIRPAFLPGSWGMGSENAAHRIAVRRPDGSESVYIPRRDTNSRLNTLVGGRLFPGTHHHATFANVETPDRVEVAMRSDDGTTRVEVVGRPSPRLDAGSVFADLASVSDFFERGSVGYSATSDPDRFDSLELRTETWKVVPLDVERVASSFFEDPAAFPYGTVEFDNALLMRDIHHEWHAHENLYSDATPESDKRRYPSRRAVTASVERDARRRRPPVDLGPPP